MYLIVLLLIVCQFFTSNQESYEKDNNLAEIQSFPVVSLRLYGFHICHATVINLKFLLTAADCVNKYEPRQLSIAFGAFMNYSIDIESVKLHENFTEIFQYAADYNVALVKLKQQFSMENYTNIELDGLFLKDEISDVDDITEIGWSYTTNNFELVKMIPQPICQYGFICAKTKVEGDKCGTGHAGNILIFRRVQFGILAFKRDPFACVYTNIAKYNDWILSNIAFTRSKLFN